MALEAYRPKRILVAEDVESIALVMHKILEREGYLTEIVSDGQECLDKVASFHPDLVVMDIMMPMIHGLDVLKRLKQNPSTAGIGVIICTAKSYKPDEDQAIADGAFAVIEKPFKPAYLAEKVRDFFAGVPGSIPTAVAWAPHVPSPVYEPSVNKGQVIIRLWGTRGSIPVSGSRYSRHGGNTSCISIERGDDAIIIDAGSGIRDLGFELARKGPRRIHLFIGHTHWDHIQGFPFFVPAFIPGFEIVVYGASGFGKDLESVFRGQLDRDYFPVQLSDMSAKLEFRKLEGDSLQIGAMKVRWEYMQHPGATLGFRVETGGKSVSYITDNEFLMGYLRNPRAAESDEGQLAPYRKVVDFISGSDLLVAEAQYTNAEYPSKVGWGHCSASNACLLAKLGGITDWIVVHHDPQHDDAFVEEKTQTIRRIARELNHEILIRSGFDGMTEYLD